MQRCISSVWGFVHSCTSPRDWISNTREHVKRRRVPGPITPVYCVTQKLRYFIFNRILSERHKIYFLTSQRTQSFCIINTDLLIMFRKRFAFYSENHTKYMSKLFFISVFNQLGAQNVLHNKFYFMPLHVSITSTHHQEVKIALHSLWYHHTYRCDDIREILR